MADAARPLRSRDSVAARACASRAFRSFSGSSRYLEHSAWSSPQHTVLRAILHDAEPLIRNANIVPALTAERELLFYMVLLCELLGSRRSVRPPATHYVQLRARTRFKPVGGRFAGFSLVRSTSSPRTGTWQRSGDSVQHRGAINVTNLLSPSSSSSSLPHHPGPGLRLPAHKKCDAVFTTAFIAPSHILFLWTAMW